MILPSRHTPLHFIASLAIDCSNSSADVPVHNTAISSASKCAMNLGSQDTFVANSPSPVTNGSSWSSWANSFYNSNINDS